MMEDQPILIRILYIAAYELGHRRATPAEIRHWLGEHGTGRQLVDYLAGEADLMRSAADRLNLLADEDLRALGSELARSAERLALLAEVGGGSGAHQASAGG